MIIKQYLKKINFIKSILEVISAVKRDKFLIQFLDGYFSSPKEKYIIQVGANDGEMSDPLRKYLKLAGIYSAVLIEPIPYYFDKLKKLYADRKDIELIQTALGSANESKDLYFIPPVVADQMNGDGPVNNWAHGQGSFSKEVIEYWIRKNNFRGAEYSKNIDVFISSIEKITIPIKRLSDFIPAGKKNVLLVIDAQGFELEVLKGIDWELARPEFIVLEDDLPSSKDAIRFLEAKGYGCLGGGTDKVFSCQYPKKSI